MPGAVQPLIDRAQQRTTPCGSGELVWHVWGTAQPGVAPLVMLHGGSGSWTHWVRNIDALVAAGRELWLPDLPGFGASAPPPLGTDADALVEPLRAGLQALLGEQPVEWFDAPGSKVDSMKEARRFIKDIARIRMNDMRGVYMLEDAATDSQGKQS